MGRHIYFSIMCQMPTEFVIQKIVNCNSESQTLNAILCKRHDPTRVFNAIIQLSEANGNEVNIVSSNENFSDVTGHFVPCYLPDGKSFSDLSVKEILTYIIHSGFISGYQNRYGDNLKPPTNVYHRMTA